MSTIIPYYQITSPFSYNYFSTSPKVTASIPDEVIGFFIGLTLPAAIWPWG
jgi:hypothetical protein